MEKYFIVGEGTKLYNAYIRYSEERKKAHELANKFLKKHDIESTSYGVFLKRFYILPNENDKEKFDKVLMNPVQNGLRAFKYNTLIAKDWIKMLKDNNLEIHGSPHVSLYFKGIYGKHKTRLFDINGTVYCSIERDGTEDIEPQEEGYEEIKASEFYKEIEDEQERCKK